MKFAPVCSLADLETLDPVQIIEGYVSAERGDPEPGENRGRAFWHGWRNRMIDYGELPGDEASRRLAHEYAHKSPITAASQSVSLPGELTVRKR